jgi:hypothetical protein
MGVANSRMGTSCWASNLRSQISAAYEEKRKSSIYRDHRRYNMKTLLDGRPHDEIATSSLRQVTYIRFEIETNMLKTAVVIVLKKYWKLVVSLLLINVVLQYWWANHISWAVVLLTFVVVASAVLLVTLPVEFHKLRNTR